MAYERQYPSRRGLRSESERFEDARRGTRRPEYEEEGALGYEERRPRSSYLSEEEELRPSMNSRRDIDREIEEDEERDYGYEAREFGRRGVASRWSGAGERGERLGYGEERGERSLRAEREETPRPRRRGLASLPVERRRQSARQGGRAVAGRRIGRAAERPILGGKAAASRRGVASMPSEQRREIASRGGRASSRSR